ncbi:hypothetical protein HYS91_05280 [Candidatus Daviesbacteria bacterium]|nr:hypothetical protein [Candidatus Daviesbacteria bacterium]
MLELSEPINVWVFFKGVKVHPYIFFWKDRKIQIDKINLVHTAKEEGNLVYFFSVSSKDGNFYRLKFELKSLKWFLEAVEESE